MSDDQRWADVARALAAAVEASPWTESKLVERAGVDYRSFNKALRGEEISPALRKKIAIGIGWTPDSLDRVLRGDPPEWAGDNLPGLAPGVEEGGPADSTDLHNRIARLGDEAQQAIKVMVDAFEKAMDD